VTLGDQLVDNADPLLGRRILPDQTPDALERFPMGFEDNYPILDTSKKIATIGHSDLSAKRGRKDQSAIIGHLYM
jgi:hypothetical protein